MDNAESQNIAKTIEQIKELAAKGHAGGKIDWSAVPVMPSKKKPKRASSSSRSTPPWTVPPVKMVKPESAAPFYEDGPFHEEAVKRASEILLSRDHTKRTSSSESTEIANKVTEIGQMAAYAAGYIDQLHPSPFSDNNMPKQSLRNFMESGLSLEGSGWSVSQISEAIASENWRSRDAGEIAREGDILCHYDNNGAVKLYENIICWKDQELKAEDLESSKVQVFTMEGGGKPKKPVVYKLTSEFDGILSVPRGTFLKLPDTEQEARRFFGCEVVPTEVVEKGRPYQVYYPVLSRFRNQRFRAAFSRLFSDFSRRRLRSHIRAVADREGSPQRLVKGVSSRYIRTLSTGTAKSAKGQPKTVEEIVKITKLPTDFVHGIVHPEIAANPRKWQSALERVRGRKLTPHAFGYDRAIGIEIEVVSPMSADSAAERVPSYVRVDYDGSLRNNDNVKMSAEGGNHPNQLAAGLNNQWGVEFRLLIKRSEAEERIRRVTNIMDKIGCFPNVSCGLHIHFDMRYPGDMGRFIEPHDEMTPEEVEARREYSDLIYKRAEHLRAWLFELRELLPEKRRNNKYCAFENPDTKHHAAVATDCFRKHGTIEVRVHSSTTDPIKIIRWINLCESIMTLKYPPLEKTGALHALKQIPLKPEERDYWFKRHHQLNPKLYGTKPDLSFLTKPNEIE